MQHLESDRPLAVGAIRVQLALDGGLLDYVQSLFPKSREKFPWSEFEQFPEKHNWQIKDNKLQPKNSSKQWNKRAIMQGWLFFGLIAFVVRTEGPLLSFENLLSPGGHSTRSLETHKLPEKLQEWHDWLKEQKDKDKAKLHRYLIEVDRALELARRVVRASFEAEQINLDQEEFPGGSPIDRNTHQRVGSNSDVDKNRKLELCLMVLGETLSAVKTHIMKDLELTINGWFMDDDEGWGPPSYVLAMMQEDKWCPRAQTILRGQLGASAILLYAAYANREKNSTDISRSEGRHKHCTKYVCYFVQGRKILSVVGREIEYENEYQTAHHDALCQRNVQDEECSLLGPNMETVTDMLRNTDWTTEAEEFPLFRIVSEVTGKYESGHDIVRARGVTVEKWSRQNNRNVRSPEFTAISHVWSQGMGNETANMLQECQLVFILTVLNEAAKEDNKNVDPGFKNTLIEESLNKDPNSQTTYTLSAPFWMDTLAIPIINKDKKTPGGLKLKQTAIRQIYHVYNSASRVLVIDKELCKNPGASTTAQSVIKILTSHWMRRLWTLQEAFLGQRLSIVFEVESDGKASVQDLDSYLSKLERVDGGGTSRAFLLSLAEFSKRKLYHSLMGEDREIRNRKDHPILSRGSLVLASAWRSSRWRNTSRLEDETLALSTLLNLDYRGTLIEKASEIAKYDKDQRPEWRHRMMRDFWTLIHRTYEGSIPAGLIFLPGKRLPMVSFGWAPSTWMSGKDEHYPYPLTLVGKPTELRQEGLLVQYPGFLLHGGDPKLILGTNHADTRELNFPTERHLSEWYKANAIKETDTSLEKMGLEEMAPEGKIRQRIEQNTRLSNQFGSNPPEFGIILSRPKPSEWPKEIGLLVEVYSELWRRKEPERINKKIYFCQIIHRVEVCRIPKPTEPAKSTKPTHATKPNADQKVFWDPSGERPIGEVMPEDTIWCVDGYQDIETRNALKRPSTPEKTKNNGNTNKPKFNGGVPGAPLTSRLGVRGAFSSPSGNQGRTRPVMHEPTISVLETPSGPSLVPATNEDSTRELDAMPKGGSDGRLVEPEINRVEPGLKHKGLFGVLKDYLEFLISF